MIITDEKLLRTKCEDVKIEEIEDLRNKLEAELKKCARRGRPGVGLSAPQIGIFKKMAIVRLGGQNGVDLVNPKIIDSYNESDCKGEGCLSFPGKTVNTRRFKEIVVETDVKPYKLVATDLVAVCIQHEIDHLNGILMFDRAVK